MSSVFSIVTLIDRVLMKFNAVISTFPEFSSKVIIYLTGGSYQLSSRKKLNRNDIYQVQYN